MAFVIALAIGPAASAQPLPVPEFMRSHAPRALLQQGKFAELDQAYAKLRVERKRDVEGNFLTEDFFGQVGLDGGDARKWPHADERTRAWVAQSPRSVPAAVLRANVLIDRAVDLHESHDWSALDALSAEAEQLLMAVQEAGRLDSNWHAALLRIATFNAWDMRKLKAAIEAAMKADPLAMKPYEMAAGAIVSFLKPQPEALAWLAREAVQRTQATEGRSMYARVYLNQMALGLRELRREPFGPGHMVWAELNASLHDWYARYPTAQVLSIHAAMACVARDRAVARDMFDRVASRLETWPFQFFGGRALHEDCKAWVDTGRPIPKRT